MSTESSGRVPSPDMPISSITDGWSLKDGSLHLFVRCGDGVVRAMTIDTDRSKSAPARPPS